MTESKIGRVGIEVDCDTAQVDEAIGKLRGALLPRLRL